MVERDQQQRFNKLRLDGGPFHNDNGLTWEDGRTLRHGPDIAVKTEVAKVIQKTFGKAALRAQVADIALVEMEVVYHLAELRQPRRNGKAAVIRYLAEEHVENAHLVLIAAVKIAAGHSELIKIHQKCQVAGFADIFHNNFSLIEGPSKQPGAYIRRMAPGKCGIYHLPGGVRGGRPCGRGTPLPACLALRAAFRFFASRSSQA